MLLVFEMTLFMSLIVPMPFTWKRKLFTFLSENPLVAKMQYWLKVCYDACFKTMCKPWSLDGSLRSRYFERAHANSVLIDRVRLHLDTVH